MACVFCRIFKGKAPKLLISCEGFHHSSNTSLMDTFLYFAYGSNLLTERIRLNNPTAVKLDVAKLQDYKLDFNVFAERWQGAVATIIPRAGDHVWGVVWRLNNEDLRSLDRQEAGYDPLDVCVESADGDKYVCRTYQLIMPSDDDHKPSGVYKNVIIKGAIENGLPKEYIQELCEIVDNGYNGPVKIKLTFRG